MFRRFRFRRKMFLTLVAVIIASLINSFADEPDVRVTDELILSTTKIENTEEVATQQDAPPQSQINSDTYIFLADDKTAIGGSGASFADNQLTITKSGTYTIKGSLSNGRIFVDCNDDFGRVVLVLSGATVHSSNSAPIYIENATEVLLYLKNGTVNSLSDSRERELLNGAFCGSSAVIYSKKDLEISGTGTLNITAGYNKGIFSKGDIEISSAVINILCADDGIRGKEEISVESGEISITCGGDGIRTSSAGSNRNNDIMIYGGNFEIASFFDGIDSEGDLMIKGGNFEITTGGGSTGNNKGSSDNLLGQQSSPTKDKTDLFKGKNAPKESSTFESVFENNKTEKAIKAKDDIKFSSADLQISSQEDGIYCQNLTIDSGDIIIRSDGKGIYCSDEAEINSGDIKLLHCFGGITSKNIKINYGTLVIDSCENGIKTYSAEIREAYIHIDSEKTAIICNEELDISGGEIYIFGSEKTSLPILKCEEINVNAGTFLALGNGRIKTDEIYIEEDIRILSCLLSKSVIGMGAIVDQKGESIIGFRAPRRFKNIFFCSDKLTSEESYTLYKGGSFTEDGFNGIYNSGTYTGGKLVKTMK